MARPPRALDTRRPFTRAQGLAAGITPARLRGTAFRRVLPGVYVDASAARRPHERVEAALLVHPEPAYVSHTSAARVYGLPVPRELTEEHITVFRRQDRRNRRGVRSHLAPASGSTTRLSGIRLSTPDQLFLEMATLLNLVDLVVLGDDMVARRLTTPEGLVRAAAASTGNHSRKARRAAGLVRPEVDSPMETRLRLLLVLAGLPEPRINHKIYEKGRLLYRFDLSYPGLRLAVEHDGRQHRDDDDQWDADIDRDDWLDHHDWMIVKVFSRGVYREPAKTIERVRRAILARGGRVPRRLSEEW
ncbi:MAG TPA: hypothetical protein VFV40_00965, partial [Nocardioides sp.]|nr:hypothetical protein [Nocardioides sp.]